MRKDLDLQIDQLSTSVVAMAERADEMLAGALRALADTDRGAANATIDADVGLDEAYEQVQHGVLAVVALHGPVGHDLRLLTGLVHVSLHLERMGDYAVNTARAALAVAEHTADPDLTEQVVEMGNLAREVGRAAMRSFVQEDPELAHQAAELDDQVDRYDRGIFQRLVRLAGQDEDRLEWATRMIRVSRHLERYADHGVDVAEQTVFVATGETLDLGRRRPD